MAKMPVLNEWRPGSFTKNFSWGSPKQGLKEHGGVKSNVLPDFLIGAQAEAAQAPLLTVNSKDFMSYFAKLNLVCPT
jgi:predicted nucleic acid-binding protein